MFACMTRTPARHQVSSDIAIRRGTDIVKAMAPGASAVLVGRPAVWGLAHAGAAGVPHMLRLLRDELEIAMALTGCATLAEASPALLDADAIADSRG
ncbi:MAG: alpha-hydroxy-acid oxidizing protein [Acidovorax sp.]